MAESEAPGEAGAAEPTITAPFYVDDWMSLNRAHELADSSDGQKHWIDIVLGLWERMGGVDLGPHAGELRSALERVGSNIPEGVQRFILRQPPYDDPSVVTFWLVALDEPIRGGARRERVAPDQWVMRRRGRRHELHAMQTGAPAPEAALTRLLGEIDVEEPGKQDGALKQLGDFFSFWSFGGRL